MKTKMKRILSVFLALTVLCSAFCAGMIQAGATQIYEGYCGKDGNNLKFTLYSDRIIVISGTGEMADYSSTSPMPPWKSLGITFMAPKVAVASGVTSIGNNAFYGCNSIHWIDLPNSLQRIGENAFSGLNRITELTVPSSINSIGNGAFSGCTNLKDLNLYPSYNSNFNLENSGLNNSTIIHVLSENLSSYTSAYPTLIFRGDLNELVKAPENSNIFYVDNDNSNQHFGGVKSFNLLAKPSGENKTQTSITNASAGFVSCIRIKNGNNYDYYGLKSHNDGILYKMNINPQSNKVENLIDSSILTSLTLRLGFEYIGTNAVKVTYIVQNNSDQSISFKLGTAGDIQIGSDDQAAIAPLEMEERQIGITMTTNKNSTAEDLDGSNNPLTLGFIGKEVGGSVADAKYFYGKVDSNISQAAAGVRAEILYPQRIFEMNTNSYSSGSFNDGDSGLSYYWDVNLPANDTKEYSVIFSVLGTDSDKKDEAVIEKVNEGTDESSKNIGVTEDYLIPSKTKVYFDDEIPVVKEEGKKDTLAETNGYSTLRNFLLLGVQKKTINSIEPTTNDMRFVSVAKTGLLSHADEYGYLIAKTSQSYDVARSKINQLTYNSSNVVKINCKRTSNQISGDYGVYEDFGVDKVYNTPYKYVTLALNKVPDGTTVMARFYIKTGNNVYYADYYNKDKDKFDGCASAWADLTNA